ncbi:deoxyuridine 5'-triphosphate nucleotidohydrolase [Leptolyngbya valderiana BDU 20041]|nr:deoxyuridine 5'-triphosphate nucleotidohydrolase [Leptolyngbya valderiana BDU 20041]
MTPPVRFRVLDERAAIPRRQTTHAAGLDLAACLPPDQQTLTLEPGQIAIVPTGLAIAIPDGFEGQVRPRSGLATKRGVTVPNAPGTIDADYRGELRVALINLSKEPQPIEHGDRIAQLVIAPVAMCEVVVVDELDETVRGAGGFGSTGVATSA